jgi:thiol peroxidase
VSRTVLFKGNPIAIDGPELKAGDKAPDFTVQASGAAGLGDVKLSDFAGKTLVLSVVPSIDTGVCAIQTKQFNTRAAELPDSVAILTVSTDLPFAQGRFCGAEGIDKLKTVSDHRDVSFGASYGVLITEGPLKRVLTRAVFVVNPEGVLSYVQYVPEVTTEPDYDAALAAIA